MEKRYIDNAANRKLGRVGKLHGTAVQSSHSCSSSSSSSASSSSHLENSLSHSRDGKANGAASNSRPSSASSSPKTYVDNAENRRLGRVGMVHGTAVHSRSNDTLTLKFDGLTIKECSAKVYKDNAMNRKLGRAGKPLGSMKLSSQSSSSGETGATAQHSGNSRKVYVDNSYNRKYNRVGKPLGSVPIPAKERVYKDTPLNRQLGRVGLPWGTHVHKKNPQNALLKRMMDVKEGDDIPEDIAKAYEDSVVFKDRADHFLEMMNRSKCLKKWLERNETASWNPHDHTHRLDKTKYQGNIIDYDELKISEKIGHGGFSDVFMAEWVEDRLVAVKKLRVQRVSKKRLERFEGEIRVYCQLDHKNIVDFLGACTVPPNLAIVMEFMEMSLFDALHQYHVDFPDNEKIIIMRNVADGLDYLHEHSIAHCDLKPQNVLLNNVPGSENTDEKEPVLAKISDFGLSKIKHDEETQASQSPEARHVGTPLYSAPEVLRGEVVELEQLMKTDVYSLGLIILELVTEEIAFSDLNKRQLEVQVGENGLKPEIARRINFNQELLRKLKQCWSSDPNERPSAKEFALFAERFQGPIIDDHP